MDIGKSIGLEYGLPIRNSFGETLRAIGGENPNLIVLDGDVGNSTRTNYFRDEYPERFFNFGIAESNIVGTASGLAAAGKDVLAASFACFLLCNAYDQIRMSIAFPQENVKLVGSHSGISIGEDGPSQMAIEDIALATSLPRVTVVAPADEPSMRAATRAIFEVEGPVYLRSGRPKVPIVYRDGVDFELGKANQLREGDDVTIIAYGLMVAAALEAAAELSKDGIEARVLDMHTVKPLDTDAVERAARETGAIVTAEEHVLNGGMGAEVARTVGEQYPVPMAFVGIDNAYAESGDPEELLRKYGLMPTDIKRAVNRTLTRK
ncbi:MAG: transketolase family protein [Anaerolineae bacterium]|nr:transketolase family protein [Anaerolineae bacterium]